MTAFTGEGSDRMKRLLVFTLLSPVSAVAAWLIYFVQGGHGSGEFAAAVSLLLFCVTSVVAIIAWFVDGYLAPSLPLALRAPLAAIIGGTIAGGLSFATITIGWMFLLSISPFAAGLLPATAMWTLPLKESVPFAIGGALFMGVCSFLSHDYRP